jgi:hypothetical protein
MTNFVILWRRHAENKIVQVGIVSLKLSRGLHPNGDVSGILRRMSR